MARQLGSWETSCMGKYGHPTLRSARRTRAAMGRQPGGRVQIYPCAFCAARIGEDRWHVGHAPQRARKMRRAAAVDRTEGRIEFTLTQITVEWLVGMFLDDTGDDCAELLGFLTTAQMPDEEREHAMERAGRIMGRVRAMRAVVQLRHDKASPQITPTPQAPPHLDSDDAVERWR